MPPRPDFFGEDFSMMRKLSLDRIAFKLALLYSSAGKRPLGAAAPRYVDHLPCRDKHTVHGQYAPWINTCTRSACVLPEPRCLLEVEANDVVAGIRRTLITQR
jgi:hypothetical protein